MTQITVVKVTRDGQLHVYLDGEYRPRAVYGDFSALRTACKALAETVPKERRPPAMMMALHIWSLSHGIASMFARGDRARRPIPLTPEDLLEAATLIYLDGLGVPGK